MASKTDSKNKKVKAVVVAPSKKTMNFARHESNIDPKRVGIILGIIIVVLAVFAKFGILDPLAEKSKAYQELGTLQNQQVAIQQKLSKFDELKKEYGRYSYGWMDEVEISMVSRMEILELMEREIFPYAVVEDLSVTNNVLNINVNKITLEKASEIIESLEKDDLVEYAYLFYAEAENGEDALISMSITLTKEVPEA